MIVLNMLVSFVFTTQSPKMHTALLPWLFVYICILNACKTNSFTRECHSISGSLHRQSDFAFVIKPQSKYLRRMTGQSVTEIGYDDEDDEQISPGKMRVSEIKAELQLRGVRFDDCFDKESLSTRLDEARATGKSDPKILDQFNKKRLEDTLKGENPLRDVSEEAINAAVGADGKLPGGMSPEKLMQLMGNQELMALLQSPKMQDVMKLMMTEGPEGLQKAMEEDDQIKKMVIQLNEVIQKSQ